MDKFEYLCLLFEVFINDVSKFWFVFLERFLSRGRLLIYYYFFLKKEKDLDFIVCRILFKFIVDIVCFIGFRLVYLYGLLKIYKENLVMCFILLVK